MPTKKYGGFWKRFLAYLIDEFLLSTVSVIIMIPFFMFFGLLGYISPELLDGTGDHSLTSFVDVDMDPQGALAASIIFVVFIMVIILFVVSWLYHALMESSSKQATLGKMAISLKVTDMMGNRISFARASGRYFGKFLSGLIFNIGYIIAGFTEKKQALHDMIAGTLVLNKEYEVWEQVQNDLREYEEQKRREMEAEKAQATPIVEEEKNITPEIEPDIEPEDSVRAGAEEEEDTPDTSTKEDDNINGGENDNKKDNL